MLSSVGKALEVIEHISIRGEVGVNELAEELGVAPSTAHRLLNTLISKHFVVQDNKTKRYALGLKLFRIGMSVQSRMNLVQAAYSSMKKMAEITNETVNLGIIEGTEVVYVEKISNSSTAKYDYSIGRRVPIYCTSMGKALLTFMDKIQQKKLLSRINLKSITPHTITDLEQLTSQLDQFRKMGYAVDEMETDTNLRCAAVPIFDYRSEPVAALSVSGASSHFTVSKIEEIIPNLLEAGRTISQNIGCDREVYYEKLLF